MGPTGAARPDGDRVEVQPDQPGRGPTGFPTSWAAYLPTVALVAGAAWIGRRLWFFSDDWNIFAQYHSENLTEPFNGHLSLVPAGIYQALFHTVGVGSYTPYRVAGLVGLAVLGFQLARWANSRVGPVAATLAVVAVMWSSSGASNVMFPFLMNFSLPIAALLAIWWHLDRARVDPPPDAIGTGRQVNRHLIAIGLWLALALATSGLGVMAAVALAVELALRRAPLRYWIPWAAPVSVWGIWWIGHRGASDISTDVTVVVPYTLRMLLAGTTAVGAGWKPLGILLAFALVIAILALTVGRRSLDPRVAAGLCAALAFAVLTALTRQDAVVPIPPDELRYGWTIGAYLVVAVVALVTPPDDPMSLPACSPGAGTAGSDPEAWWQRHTAAASRAAASRAAASRAAASTRVLWRSLAVLAALILAAGAVRLADSMVDWADQVADAAPGLRSNVYAAEALGVDRTPPEAVIGPLSYVPVRAHDYLDAVADVGSPLHGSTPADIGGRPEQRAEADALLFDGLAPLRTSPLVAQADPSACSASAEAQPGSTWMIVVDGDRRPRAAVELGRFAEPRYRVEVPTGLNTLSLPEDAPVGTDAEVPYHLGGIEGALLCPIP